MYPPFLPSSLRGYHFSKTGWVVTNVLVNGNVSSTPSVTKYRGKEDTKLYFWWSASAYTNMVGISAVLTFNLDGVFQVQNRCYTNELSSHRCFTPIVFEASSSKQAAGTYTLDFAVANGNTLSNADDYFNVTSFEIPI